MSDDPSPQPAAIRAPAPQRVLNANFLRLNVAAFLSMLTMSMFNLLPYYLELRGASQGFYGAVAGSMGISNVIVMMAFGHTADRWSRRTSVFIYSLPMVAASALSIVAMGHSLNWYFLVRLLQGVYLGLGFPIMYAWVVELTPAGRKHEAVALFGVAGLSANTLGPLIGEMILNAQPDPNHPDAYLPVFWTSLVIMAGSALSLFLVPSVKPQAGDEDERQSIMPLLRRPESQLLILVTFFFGGMFGIYTSFGKNFTASLGLTYASVLFGTYSGGAIASRVLIRPMTRLLLERNLIPAGFVGVAFTFLLLAVARQYTGLAVAGICYGLGHGVLYPALFVRFLDMQRPSEIGRATILYQGLFSAGWGFLPYLGGYYIQVTSFQSLFSLIAGLCGVGMLFHLQAERVYAARNPPEHGAS